MDNGRDLLNENGGKGEGIPWIEVIDGSGDQLANSTGPDGNCGCPVAPQEIDHFINMIEKTAKEPTKESLAAIRKSLEDYTAQWRN